MVDMGFAPDLRRILRLLPRERQTLMFSATIPPDLNKVASEALRDPVRVDLAPPTRPAAGITQAVYPVPRALKTDLLDAILSLAGVGSVIVFARTKHGADRLAHQLERRGYSVASLHSNRSQSQRERALDALRRGRVQVLVATDIASRGIDVEAITHVINYDVPHSPEDYVHRIGRTGRVDAVGDAFTLVAPEEQKSMDAIERFLGRAIPRVTLPDFDYRRRPEKAAPSRPPFRGASHGPSRGSARGTPRGGPHGPQRGASQGTSRGGARPAPNASGPQHGRRPRRANPMERRRGGRM
jgi:ATP-dependent RNA helicase RhlE